MPIEDTANLVGLGIGSLLLVLTIRVLSKQGDGWKGVLAAVQADAHTAREDAAVARADAAIARKAEQDCRRRLAQVETRLDQLEAQTPAKRPQPKRRN